ncbi:MAG: 8-amino-7-oxononanoate synthase [Chromatiales bacterium]|nr:8-amino-7-oxononanoate synthase [Chromatiales bacterium]
MPIYSNGLICKPFLPANRHIPELYLKNLHSIIDQQYRLGLYRQRRIISRYQEASRVLNGQKKRPVISFSSNDYLGLANDPDVVNACIEGARRYGSGAGASCLIDGYTQAHQELEEALAQFLSRERALVFSSGYLANLGILTTLADRHTVIYADKLNHASLVDAALLSRANLQRYAHTDTVALRDHLSQEKNDAIVVSDAVFSMQGDIAPLTELSNICADYTATLVVDDAHGLGVLGAGGRGTLEHFGLNQTQVPVVMATLGKSLGASGAFVAGSADLIEVLIQKARTYIYTTALPPPMVCAARASLEIIQNDNTRREILHRNINLFRSAVAEHGISCLDSATAIQGVIVGDAKSAVALSEALLDEGLLVVAIRPPTVPLGTARLRIMLSAAHCEEDIVHLVKSLAKLLPLISR